MQRQHSKAKRPLSARVKPVVSSTHDPGDTDGAGCDRHSARHRAGSFLGLRGTMLSLPLFSARYPAFDLDEAYRASALAHKIRLGKGYKFVGRKAGFTNSRIWDEYGVRAPNWGYVYDRTLHDLATPFSLAPYAEPKIEPEIIVGFPPRRRRAWMMPHCWRASAGSPTVSRSSSPFSELEIHRARQRRRERDARRAADRAASRHRLARDGVAARPARIRSRTILRRHVDGSRPRLERARRAAVGHPSPDPACLRRIPTIRRSRPANWSPPAH